VVEAEEVAELVGCDHPCEATSSIATTDNAWVEGEDNACVHCAVHIHRAGDAACDAQRVEAAAARINPANKEERDHAACD
jgi:hypothetical protein